MSILPHFILPPSLLPSLQPPFFLPNSSQSDSTISLPHIRPPRPRSRPPPNLPLLFPATLLQTSLNLTSSISSLLLSFLFPHVLPHSPFSVPSSFHFLHSVSFFCSKCSSCILNISISFSLLLSLVLQLQFLPSLLPPFPILRVLIFFPSYIVLPLPSLFLLQ